MTSHMVVDTSLDVLHGSGAQFVETAGLSKPQTHKGDTERPVRRNSGSAMESAYVRDCVGRCSQVHSEYEYGECVVDMHVPPIKGIAKVKFKVVAGTEPTLSTPMLLANSNRVILRGEVATLITAKGETAPLMNAGNGWYFKVLTNNTTEFTRIDVWTLCHTCLPSWVRNLSPEIKQRERCMVREQFGRKDHENSRKSMQLCLNSLMGTSEMEVLRFLSNPETWTMQRSLSESNLVQGPGVNQRIERQNNANSRLSRGMSQSHPQCAISTVDNGEQVDHRNTGKGKSKHTGKGKGNHVDVVETNQPSETASTVLAVESGDFEENMNMVRTEAEAWRPIHNQYAQNTLTTGMISGSLLHDHADKHNQLPDESKKQTEDLAGIQAQHQEQQIFFPRSLGE